MSQSIKIFQYGICAIFLLVYSGYGCADADSDNEDMILYGVQGGFSRGGARLDYSNGPEIKAGDGDEVDIFAGIGLAAIPFNLLLARSVLSSNVEQGGNVSLRRHHTDLVFQYRNSLDFYQVRHRLAFALAWYQDTTLTQNGGNSGDFELNFQPTVGAYVQYSMSMANSSYLHFIARYGTYDLSPDKYNRQAISNSETLHNNYWALMIGLQFWR